MSDDLILETRELTKEFKGFVAVDKVNLRVRRGSIHALIGPNGAGKTTCFNLLTKFLKPTSGRILFAGSDITAEAPAAIARRGVVRSFQISAVFAHLSVLENVRVALQRKLGTSFHFWRSESSLTSLDARALDYLLKPVEPERLRASLFQKMPYPLLETRKGTAKTWKARTRSRPSDPQGRGGSPAVPPFSSTQHPAILL